MGNEVTQFGRALSLVVAGADGKGLDFAQFRVRFQVRKGDFQTPNTCTARIYNLSQQTANMIAQPEFTTLSLSAGYNNNPGLIFRGSIMQFRKGRDDAKDSYVDITAADGDHAYSFAAIAQPLKAGTAPGGIAQALLTAMQSKGIDQGQQPEFKQSGCVRGRVLYGMARDELRDFAASQGCSWSIQDGALTFIPLTGYIPGNVPVISPSSGLIGTPEQSQQGLALTVLLNPNIKVGQCIKLETNAINVQQLSLDSASLGNNLFALDAGLKQNADGLYYVMLVDHHGDTRGNDWYSELLCLAADATVPSKDALNSLFAVNPPLQRYQ